MIYILSLLFTLAFVYYSKWQFNERINAIRSQHTFMSIANKKWHVYGMLMRLLAIVTPFILQYYSGTWQDYLLAGSINILAWELLINKIALSKEWFYVGKTAKTDKYLGKYKWHLAFILLIVATIIKFGS